MASELTITSLAPRDIRKFIDFTMVGMNFEQLMPNKILAREYARYFVHEVLQEATHVYAAYDGEEFLGALIFDAGEGPRPYSRLSRGIYTKAAEFIERTVFAKTAGAYHQINKQLIEKAGGKNRFQGELKLFAVSPHAVGKGVGSLLLNRLTLDHGGKEIFLYTDSGCSYGFYPARGFELAASISAPEVTVPPREDFSCMIFVKKL